MRLSIAATMRSFAVLICLGLIAIEAVALLALARLDVSGPVYNRIVTGKELLGDIALPPLDLGEAYLDANLAAHDFTRIRLYKSELASLHQRYDDRETFWSGVDLPPLKAALTQNADAYAQTFWQQVEQNLLPAIEAGNQQAVTQSMTELGRIFQTHRAVVQDIVTKTSAFDDANQAMAVKLRKIYTYALLGAAVAMLCLIGFGLRVITLLVRRPINGIARSMSNLAAGDVSMAIPDQDRTDEIGHMVAAVAVFRTTLLRLREADANLATARRDAADERRENEAAREEALKAHHFVVDSLANGLVRFANGDLTCHIHEWFGADYKTLRMDFNHAVTKMQSTMRDITEMTRNVEQGANEIMHATTDLSRRTEQQAARLEETAAAVDEVAATVRQTSISAGSAAERADAASIAAKTSG
jgi:methyl-accepting chemotaxis protein